MTLYKIIDRFKTVETTQATQGKANGHFAIVARQEFSKPQNDKTTPCKGKSSKPNYLPG